MSQDYASAQWIPTTHCGGWVSTFQPKWVIIHGTSDPSPAVNIARYFQTNDPPSSTHYIVDRDGTVVQCVSEDTPAWGNGVITAGHDPWWPNVPAGNPNSCSLSIEHVKPQGNVGGLTDAQKAASFALVAHLVQKHGIPVKVAHTARLADAEGGITAHASIDPVNRAMCPGDYPWAELLAHLDSNGGQTTMADMDPAYFAPDGDGYRCTKTKQLIRGDILAAYRADGGLRRLGLPRTGEVPLAGGKHGETAQLFERGVLVFDPQRAFDNPPGASGTVYYGQMAWLLPALDPAWVASLAPKPTPADPVKEKAFAALQDLKSALAEL